MYFTVSGYHLRLRKINHAIQKWYGHTVAGSMIIVHGWPDSTDYGKILISDRAIIRGDPYSMSWLMTKYGFYSPLLMGDGHDGL